MRRCRCEQLDGPRTVMGTVGAVALDEAGNLAAATSTGGMTGKRWGRVGDSPLIGAGTYAANDCCAVSATGHGEFFIRAAVAHEIASLVRTRSQRRGSGEHRRQEQLRQMGGEGGVIAIGRDGSIAMPFNSQRDAARLDRRATARLTIGDSSRPAHQGCAARFRRWFCSTARARDLPSRQRSSLTARRSLRVGGASMVERLCLARSLAPALSQTSYGSQASGRGSTQIAYFAASPTGGIRFGSKHCRCDRAEFAFLSKLSLHRAAGRPGLKRSAAIDRSATTVTRFDVSLQLRAGADAPMTRRDGLASKRRLADRRKRQAVMCR